MATESSSSTRVRIIRSNDSAGFLYVLGWLASLIYFIQHATSFGMGVLGVVKAFIWPVFLIYKALEFFHL